MPAYEGRIGAWSSDVCSSDLAACLGLLPKKAGGRALRHVLDVRDPDFVDARYLALARSHGMATVFTDSPEHPSFADVTADFAYARLMRARTGIETGYPAAELRQWAGRARHWAAGGDPDDLPRVAPTLGKPEGKGYAFIYFIIATNESKPAKPERRPVGKRGISMGKYRGRQ